MQQVKIDIILRHMTELISWFPRVKNPLSKKLQELAAKASTPIFHVLSVHKWKKTASSYLPTAPPTSDRLSALWKRPGSGAGPTKQKGMISSAAGFHGKMESPTMEARSSLLPVVGDGMAP